MDPGYGSTSKMLAEAALALVQDVPRTQTPGGCWSPACESSSGCCRASPDSIAWCESCAPTPCC